MDFATTEGPSFFGIHLARISEQTRLWIVAFAVLFVYRYTRFVVHIARWIQYKAVSKPAYPMYGARDVTVLIPTICDEHTEKLEEALQRIGRQGPKAIFLIGVNNQQYLDPLVAKYKDSFFLKYSTQLNVVYSPEANKRRQLRLAMETLVRTDVTIMVDDDVLWPENLLPYILAPFTDGQVGGVGTLQRIHRQENLTFSEKVWEYIGACYIQRRNVEIVATTSIDGGTSCLSGRTGAFRSEILRNPDYLNAYCNEMWRGNLLKADDDNFTTRWLFKQGWKIVIQSDKNAVCETFLDLTMDGFLKQCLRWVRSTWRSNWTTLTRDSDIWMRQPWSTYALYTVTPSISLVVDPLLLLFLYGATSSSSSAVRIGAMIGLSVWIALSKAVKFIPLYIRNPDWVLFIPFTLVFGYFHSFIRYKALFTLSETGWVNRATDDELMPIKVPEMEQGPSRRHNTHAYGTLGRSRN